MILNFFLFITHSALIIMKKANPKGMILRSLNIVSVMVCNFLTFIFSVFYMFLISGRILQYNKIFAITTILVLWAAVFIYMRKKYQKDYRNKMKEALDKCPINNSRIILLFFGCFLASFLIVGLGVLCIHKYLHE